MRRLAQGCAMTIDRLLQNLENLTQPTTAGAPWNFLPAVPTVREWSDDPARVAAALQNEFTADELAAAGALVRKKNGSLQLAAVLQNPPFVALSRDTDKG